MESTNAKTSYCFFFLVALYDKNTKNKKKKPHSRRVKVKLTVQKEALSGVILQQTFVVEYIVANQQCDSCKKSYTENTWKACVQVRQKVDHKRTFFYLEQVNNV